MSELYITENPPQSKKIMAALLKSRKSSCLQLSGELGNEGKRNRPPL